MDLSSFDKINVLRYNTLGSTLWPGGLPTHGNDANDDDGNIRRIILDYIGSLEFMPNKPK